MFEQPKITIVLLNYKRPKNIPIILDAIKNQTVKSTVFLWNNGSENVQSPLIDRYVQSDENVGCMARWKMAKEATTPFVMSLDDDVNFNRKDVLENIIHTLENQDNPNRIIGSTGVCFGKIPFYSLRNEFLCSSRDENKKIRIFNKGKIKNTNGEIEVIRKSFILQDTAVDIIKGRMMAFRRELLNDIDLPEEREDDIFLCATFANGKRRSHLVPALLNDAFYELPTYGVGNWLQQGHFSSRNRAIRTYFSTSKALDNQIIRYIFLMVSALKILLMKMFMLLKEVLNFIIRAKKAFQTKFFKEKIVRVSTLLHRTLFFIYKQFLRPSYCNKKKSVTILCEEFFDSKLRGYGGFGKTTLNLCKHFNNNKLQHNVCLTTRLAISEKPSIQRWHNTDVFFLSPENALRWRDLRLLSSFRPALFITIEYYPSYNFPLLLLNKVPLIIYIRDPRGPEEWKKLATVPLELRMRNVNSKEDLIKFAEQKAQAMKELINSKRKNIFASNAPF